MVPEHPTAPRTVCPGAGVVRRHLRRYNGEIMCDRGPAAPWRAFVQANRKQMLGALLARYAIEKQSGGTIPVTILIADELAPFQAFEGTRYRFDGRSWRTHDADDLQSFTLTRFMPPEEMAFQGRALVIDPDVFAIRDPRVLMAQDMGDKAILACRKRDAWDSSVMLLDCARLGHWKITCILERLRMRAVDYRSVIALRGERSVGELEREWNDLDRLTPATRMMHATERLTQPWRTGLPVDFHRARLPRLLGIVPREPLHLLLGRRPRRCQPHPNPEIERFFFALLKEAVESGAIRESWLEREVAEKRVRGDLLEKLATR